MRTYLFALIVMGMLPQTNLFAQQKNTIIYKSEKFSELLVKEYFSNNPITVYDKVIGIDVKIKIDTVFKKYTIVFTNEDGKIENMAFSYIGEYFPESKGGDSKIYHMLCNDKGYMLTDLLDDYSSIIIIYDNFLAEKATLLYKIKNAKRVAN